MVFVWWKESVRGWGVSAGVSLIGRLMIYPMRCQQPLL